MNNGILAEIRYLISHCLTKEKIQSLCTDKLFLTKGT